MGIFPFNKKVARFLIWILFFGHLKNNLKKHSKFQTNMLFLEFETVFTFSLIFWIQWLSIQIFFCWKRKNIFFKNLTWFYTAPLLYDRDSSKMTDACFFVEWKNYFSFNKKSWIKWESWYEIFSIQQKRFKKAGSKFVHGVCIFGLLMTVIT